MEFLLGGPILTQHSKYLLLSCLGRAGEGWRCLHPHPAGSNWHLWSETQQSQGLSLSIINALLLLCCFLQSSERLDFEDKCLWEINFKVDVGTVPENIKHFIVYLNRQRRGRARRETGQGGITIPGGISNHGDVALGDVGEWWPWQHQVGLDGV